MTMTAREAFGVLVRGTHRLVGHWESEQLKAQAFFTPTWHVNFFADMFGLKKSAVRVVQDIVYR
jgi:hypothetical protein